MNKNTTTQMDTFVDSLDIKETIMQRINDALKEYKPEKASTGDKSISAILTALLLPLVSALATSVSVAVGEILTKGLDKISHSLSGNKTDPVLLSHVPSLTF